MHMSQCNTYDILPDEVRPLVGYEGIYTISAHGEIISCKSGRVRKSGLQSNKLYMSISLSKQGTIITHRVHRLVATTFIQNTDNKPIVNHKDGNKLNNHHSNLEWCTASENALHSIHVLGNSKPPLNFKGKFGKEHNRSKGFRIELADGKLIEFGSALEASRVLGIDHTSITVARKKCQTTGTLEYIGKKGSIKGMKILFNDSEHSSEIKL